MQINYCDINLVLSLVNTPQLFCTYLLCYFKYIALLQSNKSSGKYGSYTRYPTSVTVLTFPPFIFFVCVFSTKEPGTWLLWDNKLSIKYEHLSIHEFLSVWNKMNCKFIHHLMSNLNSFSCPCFLFIPSLSLSPSLQLLFAACQNEELQNLY